MSAIVIDVQQAEDRRDVIHRTVEALSAGKIVAVPSETVYGLIASALHPEAVERLYQIKGRSPEKPLAIATKSLEDAVDYVPNMSPLARRIGRRIWPGPVTIVHPIATSESVIHRLDPVVQAATIPEDCLGIRVPNHDLTLQIMRMCAGPIVMTSANKIGGPEPVDAKIAADSIGDVIDIVLDDGPCQLGRASSVVRVQDNRMTVLKEGALNRESLVKLTDFLALIVCTGNTCRSPMGEAIFRQVISKKLNIPLEEMASKGIHVHSAGLAAMPGSPASSQSVEVMRSQGIDISDHMSQPITVRLAQFADLILTMTNRHRAALVSEFPLLEPRVRTLRKDGSDVSDPIGSPVDIYQHCADQIRTNLQAWADEIDWSTCLYQHSSS